MSADESITNLSEAVAELGALPVPVLPEPQVLSLPWAHAMSDHDLHGFLDDLVSAAMGRWRSEPEVPDREVLADIEKVCADWRTPGQGHRLDGSEFDGAVVRLALPQAAEAVSDVAPLFPTVGSLREPEGEHYPTVHHDYLKGRDLDLSQTAVQEPDPIVAYRDPHNPRVLLCREHGERWQNVYPVTAEDLPDGGICSFGRLSSLTCGRDVLTGERSGSQR